MWTPPPGDVDTQARYRPRRCGHTGPVAVDREAPQCGHKGPAGVDTRCCQEPVRAGYTKANMSLENIAVEPPNSTRLPRQKHRFHHLTLTQLPVSARRPVIQQTICVLPRDRQHAQCLSSSALSCPADLASCPLLYRDQAFYGKDGTSI